MTEAHHRRSIRLQGYDYTQDGAYFVTLCAYRRTLLFGDVFDEEMELSTLGCIVLEEWERTPSIRAEIELDTFVIMPNHFHAILFVMGNERRGAPPCAPTETSPKLMRPPRSLGSLIAGFKSATTRRINAVRLTPGEPVWQRNYYEHIIRSEDALNQIRQYVQNNPANWLSDENHPGSLCSTAGLHTF